MCNFEMICILRGHNHPTNFATKFNVTVELIESGIHGNVTNKTFNNLDEVSLLFIRRGNSKHIMQVNWELKRINKRYR